MASKKSSRSPTLRDQVLNVLRKASEPQSSPEITTALKLKKGTRVRAHLRKLQEEGLVRREGPQNKALWVMADAPKPEPVAAPDGEGPPPTALAELVVDAMAAEIKPWKARDLAVSISTDHLEVRAELIELERIGVVYRTGRTRGTRWHLG
ncbi:MAG: hypothetical protein ACI8PZ_002472 [Myxococcota bacterium]|jgi:hypothetical protein